MIHCLTFFYVYRCLRKRNVEEKIIQNFQRNKVKKWYFIFCNVAKLCQVKKTFFNHFLMSWILSDFVEFICKFLAKTNYNLISLLKLIPYHGTVVKHFPQLFCTCKEIFQDYIKHSSCRVWLTHQPILFIFHQFSLFSDWF